MRRGSLLFTSDSVSEGHPDRIADQILDRILDAFLASDANARVACETLLADQLILVAGEFLTRDDAIYRDAFPLTPQGIIDALNLRRPIYASTAAYGHFGREEVCFAWEAPQSNSAFSMNRIHSRTPWTFSDHAHNSLIHG